MTCMQSIFVYLFFLGQFFSVLQAQSLAISPKSPETTYVTLEETLVLYATYKYTGIGNDSVEVTWMFRLGKGIYKKLVKKVGGDFTQIIDSRASLDGTASLVLTNTTLFDNGTFRLRVSSDYISWSAYFPVIIQEKTTVTPGNPSTSIELSSTSSSTKNGEKTTVTPGNPSTSTELSSTSSSTKNRGSSGASSGLKPAVIASLLGGVLVINMLFAIRVWLFRRRSSSRQRARKTYSLTHAFLDTVALQPDSYKMWVRYHKETPYAAIDLDKLKTNDV